VNHLGATRTRVARNHAFIAPDGHVQLSLPGWQGSHGVILISPQMGARFSHYLAMMQRGGLSAPPLAGVERFVFVLGGEVTLYVGGEAHRLKPHGYAYLPPDTPHRLEASSSASLSVFERRYLPLAGSEAPNLIVGNERELTGEPFLGDERLICKKLLPGTPSFDMAVNTMTFEPGVTLPFAETHFMEHGMLMLAGGGVYRLGEDWYPIQTGDAVWMGPYCPQWFGALGREKSSYLLYKEAGRDVFAFERES
jgi:(S)-ureidoglycine aminohydrolase